MQLLVKYITSINTSFIARVNTNETTSNGASAIGSVSISGAADLC